MKEFMAIRSGSGLMPATDVDADIVKAIKPGQAVRVSFVNQSARSLQHHRLFFAMLQVTLTYWDDAGSLLSPAEVSATQNFVKWIERQGGNTGAIERARKMYLEDLQQRRNAKVEPPKKSVESLLLWVKDKVGHVDLVMTPDGVKRVPKSINLNAVSQSEFNTLYKEAFSVCWRHVMSRNFASEEEAQRAIDQMASMG